jgi:hypothetical protein
MDVCVCERERQVFVSREEGDWNAVSLDTTDKAIS